MLGPSIWYISLSCVNRNTHIHTYIFVYIYIYITPAIIKSRFTRANTCIISSMSCCIVLIPLIDRLRPLKCTKHQHCPKPRLYTFHLGPIRIPGHSILICWMSSRKICWSCQLEYLHSSHLPATKISTNNKASNNIFTHRVPLSSKTIHFPSFQKHLVPGLLLVKLPVFRMPNQNLQNLPTFASSDPPFSGSWEDSPPREEGRWIWLAMGFSKAGWPSDPNLKKFMVRTFPCILRKQRNSIGGWWILSWVVSCNAIQIDTNSRWVSTNCRGSNRFQFMFLWHRQRSCIICSLNSMTWTHIMNQRLSY